MKKMLYFQTLGKTSQAVIETPWQLKQITLLDEAYWAATSVPVDLLTCDRKFLDYLDSDKNGIIRKDELCSGINWFFHILSDTQDISSHNEILPLSAINCDHEEGRALKRSAQVILSNLDHAGDGVITLEQVRNRDQILSSAASNGDGIIPPGATGSDEEASFISDVIAFSGSVTDISGAEGVSREILDSFMDRARAYLAWLEQGEVRNKAIFILGEQTARAFELFEALEKKIDQFFSLSGLCEIDKNLSDNTSALFSTLTEDELEPEVLAQKLEKAPLQKPGPANKLDFAAPVNSCYSNQAADFREHVLIVLGKKKPRYLSADQWKQIKELFSPYRLYLAGKPGDGIEELGALKLKHYCSSGLYEKVVSLIDYDQSVTDELKDIQLVEKIILYKKWLLDFANDFVCFSRFYNPHKRSLLQMGELVLDGRLFSLNVRVSNRAQHKTVAARSNICLIYSELFYKGEKQFEVATAVTWGSKKNIFIGKRGYFKNYDNRIMDSVIVDMIDNPVSITEAVKQPFKQLAGFINLQIEKFGAASYTNLEKTVGQAVEKSSNDIKQTAGAAPDTGQVPPGQSGLSGLRDILLGGSVAIAAIGTTMTMLARTFNEVDPLYIIIALLGLLFLLVFPALLTAWLKLRKRNLASLLEACGMAVNIDMMFSNAVGRLFTFVPRLPGFVKRRKIDLVYRYVRELQGSSFFKWLLLFLIILAAAAGAAYKLGYLEIIFNALIGEGQ